MKRAVESRDGNAFQSNAEGSRLRRELQSVTTNALYGKRRYGPLNEGHYPVAL
jgi:hypothetical protein